MFLIKKFKQKRVVSQAIIMGAPKEKVRREEGTITSILIKLYIVFYKLKI